MFQVDGQAALQEVFHVHLHVFPRFAGDGLRAECILRMGPFPVRRKPRSLRMRTRPDRDVRLG
ncbi:HIT domain-containing protein [Leekyejoonella antrihumi]|uniref:HIT domain-containing protein n=1 Tax=Leekyejoonella antrihumi TaxID=1660198 RepID=UPI0024822209|nr:HIT domain-containing protein [Leekyejoonella antrihumi]